MSESSVVQRTVVERAVDLRERRRRATLAEITEAAVTLFEQNGLAATTVHDIAAAAGISDRTCFRYLPSKEESVLTLHTEFEEPLAGWLADVAVDEPVLPQLEAVYVSVLQSLDGPLAPVARQQLRVRRLMFTEPALRAAAVSLDATRSWELARQIDAAFDGRLLPEQARLITEYAGIALRQAFDSWAESVDAGLTATLVEAYAATRGRLAEIAALTV
ncbi:TetR/AcrR family transcriptional regulator [Herbiconiux sp. P15]|uniref:TetR/AcrR family transcriptional regulator n=1 Tax=Herbiconiux liukaitaii TaxID=3342799 RepID=UPI0035B6B50D